MTVNQFYIEMDNPICSFFPGQFVSGRLIVESTGPTQIEGITIVFVGKASVHWTETRTETNGTGSNRTTRTHIDNYSADEEYFNCNLNIAGHGSSGTILPNGRYAYPFQFALPLELPTSFSGHNGKVYYYAEAKLKRSWKLDRKARVPFTVNSIVDLNWCNQAQLPVELRKQKYICCLCCRSGPVGLTLKMGRTGYVPGEYIEITTEMFNQSRRKVSSTNLKLIQTIEYHARTKSKSETRILTNALGPRVEEGENESWVGRVLQIPPMPPSTVGKCRIIDVKYSLMIEMDLSGLAVNLRGSIPLTIGNIPLRSTFAAFQLQPNAYCGNRIVETNNSSHVEYGGDRNNIIHKNVGESDSFQPSFPSAPGFEEYPDLPPPTYAEAVSFQNVMEREGMNAQNGNNVATLAPNDEDSTIVNYAPRYITYGWTTTPSAPTH